jgi:hypothetical protein
MNKTNKNISLNVNDRLYDAKYLNKTKKQFNNLHNKIPVNLREKNIIQDVVPKKKTYSKLKNRKYLITLIKSDETNIVKNILVTSKKSSKNLNYELID